MPSIELNAACVDARVDRMLVGDEAIPTLVIVDGSANVELPSTDPVAASRAALRIAVAAKDLADQLIAIRPSAAD